jgi:pimeloyl-ACP methyl ester carboxylesterase
MFLELDGNRVFALDFGSGPTTFLAHSGWIGNVEDWIATLAVLSKHWRVVVYDHRGTGETSVPVERITPQDLVDDVFRVMDRLQIERCILGGFSLGTVTVLRAALRQQDRFDGLVLLNGAAGVTNPQAEVGPRIPPSQWPGNDHEARVRWFVDRCTPEPGIEHVRRWATNILKRADPDAADRLFMMQFRDAIEWPRELARLRLRTLLIHGEKDAFVTTPAMQYVASLIPDASLEIIEGAGHLPAMSQPERVAGIILGHFGGPPRI